MEKRRKKKLFKIRYFLILIFGVYIISVFISQNRIISDLKEEKLQKEEEIEVLKAEIAEIQEKIEYNNSLEYIEKIAREELKMVKPNEIIYIDKKKNENSFINSIGE